MKFKAVLIAALVAVFTLTTITAAEAKPKHKTVHVVKGKKGATGAKGANGTAGAQGAQGVAGPTGPQGEKGDTGPAGANGAAGANGNAAFAGAYYSVAFYDVGDTNSGAIATVACKVQTDTAVSGGVQVLGLDAGANSRNTPVSSSFPGRMDWSVNAPFAGRLDGWIVQFAGGSIAPEKVKVWALCVPGLNIPVQQTYQESA